MTQTHQVKDVPQMNGGFRLSSDIRILTDDEVEAIARGARLDPNRLEQGRVRDLVRDLVPTRLREA